MNLIKWLREGTYLEHAVLITFTVFVFCCGIGIGLFLGLDSQEVKVKKLEAENRLLAQNLSSGIIIIEILRLRLERVNKIIKKFMDEEDKSREYNEMAVE